MSMDWNTNAFDDDGADPFGVTGDVFGQDLGDVDPFEVTATTTTAAEVKGDDVKREDRRRRKQSGGGEKESYRAQDLFEDDENDNSFGGATEWDQFNTSITEMNPTAGDRASYPSSNKSGGHHHRSSSSGNRHHRKSGSNSRSHRSSRNSTTSIDDAYKNKQSKRNINANVNNSTSSTRHMASAPKSPKSPSHNNAKSDVVEGRGRSRDGSGTLCSSSRNRTKSRTRGSGNGSRSRSRSSGPGDRDASSSTSAIRRGTKPDRKKQQQQQHLKPRHQESNPSDFDAAFDPSFSKDPFANVVSNPSEDDFIDFGSFPASMPNTESTVENGFGTFVDFGSPEMTESDSNSPTGRQRRPSNKASSSGRPPMGNMRSNSAFDINEQTSNSSRSSRSTTHLRGSRYRNAGSTRLRPRDHTARLHESNDRRSAVKDSLFGALGDDFMNDHDEKGAGGVANPVSLSNFLGVEDKRAGPRRVGGENGSISSAPAAIRSRGGSRRRNTRGLQGGAGGGDDTHSVSSSVAGGGAGAGAGSHTLNAKSRRFQRKMASPRRLSNASPRQSQTPSSQQRPIKLDIAELAKQGYLEVENGKMRLVIDVEPDE